MNASEALREAICAHIPDAIFVGSTNGEFDRAIIGIGRRGDREVVAYDRYLVIQAMLDMGFEEEDAWEWFWANIECAYYGPATPVYLGHDEHEDEEEDDAD